MRKIIYLPAPFIGLFLDWYLKPTEAWTCLWGAIVDVGQEFDFLLIMYWLRDVLTKKVGDDKLPLTVQRPTAPLADRYLIRHCHHMLTWNLPGLCPTQQRMYVLLIATHIWGFAVEMRG